VATSGQCSEFCRNIRPGALRSSPGATSSAPASAVSTRRLSAALRWRLSDGPTKHRTPPAGVPQCSSVDDSWDRTFRPGLRNAIHRDRTVQRHSTVPRPFGVKIWPGGTWLQLSLQSQPLAHAPSLAPRPNTLFVPDHQRQVSHAMTGRRPGLLPAEPSSARPRPSPVEQAPRFDLSPRSLTKGKA
jgi:hypothetical protein